MSRLLPLLACLLLAGCAAAPPPGSGPATGAPPRPAGLELTGCTGWHGDTPSLPSPLVPGKAPPGWEPDPANPASVVMDGYACSRLSVGPFERPVRIVLDSHTNVNFPPSCNPKGGSTPMAVLGTLWVNDTAVARYLNQTYGLPARASPITDEVQAVGPARAHRWTWGTGHASALNVTEDGTGFVSYATERIFWERGGGVSVLDLALQHDAPPVQHPAVGTAQPPMLLAGGPGGAFLLTTSWYPAIALTGSLTLYHDRACSEPEVGP
ncbi:MAG TPA: hypothetical protein VM241_05730 [Candidatus Thermoplasmatota archaeon]|nr:hypothetical protein [Candidatus Thermoplasmatota archaeon]